MKNFKEIQSQLKENAADRKEAKALEKAQFAALPIDEKESIRTMRASRRALYLCTGAVVVGIGAAAAATIIAAKRGGGDGGSVLEPTNSEYEAICASYE